MCVCVTSQRQAEACGTEESSSMWKQVVPTEGKPQVELAMLQGLSGKEVWQGLREIQQEPIDLQPVRPRTLRKIDHQLCMGQDKTFQCWQDLFEAVLNIKSSFLRVPSMQCTNMNLEMKRVSHPQKMKFTCCISVVASWWVKEQEDTDWTPICWRYGHSGHYQSKHGESSTHP